MTTLYFYNSLTRQKELFKPIKEGQVGLYTCGPTVYDTPHIGNLASYIVWDVLKKFLRSQKYRVEHAMNITDVGHLTSDADEGEDKLDKASKKSNQTAWDIAKKYTKVFKNNLKQLNIEEPDKWLKATETIEEQIEFVKILEKKKYLYRTSDGMYFNTTKAKKYGQLGKLTEVKQQEGARIAKNPEKKNLTDFAVWKFSPADSQRDMEWDSPWGKGFPGWHLECSVMSHMIFGNTFDIHTGGMDHLTVHHPNEMAQSRAVTGKQQANYWLHNAFIKVNNKKMSKSAGTFITLKDLKKKGFSPAAFRFLVLQNHYRKPMNFTWESLEAAQRGLINIIKEIAFFDEAAIGCVEKEADFYLAMAQDLNTPRGLAVIQSTIESQEPTHAKLQSIYNMDKVLGIGLEELRTKALDLPEGADKLLEQRKEARKNKDWAKSDRLRNKLTKMDVEIRDTDLGQSAVQVKF